MATQCLVRYQEAGYSDSFGLRSAWKAHAVGSTDCHVRGGRLDRWKNGTSRTNGNRSVAYQRHACHRFCLSYSSTLGSSLHHFTIRQHRLREPQDAEAICASSSRYPPTAQASVTMKVRHDRKDKASISSHHDAQHRDW